MDLARRQGAAPELMYVVDLPGQSVGVINDDGYCETRRWPCSAGWFGRCGLPGPASNSTQSRPGRHPGTSSTRDSATSTCASVAIADTVRTAREEAARDDQAAQLAQARTEQSEADARRGLERPTSSR